MSASESRVEAARLLVAGVQAHEANDLPRARSLYEAALALVPEQADALHLLGVVADQEGRHEEAVALIRRAIARSPQAATFHGNLGTALLALGDMAAAETAYRQALALDPLYTEAHVNLGNLLRRKGDGDTAITQYRLALANDARNADALFGLAGLLADRGQYDDALRHLTIAVQAKPQAAEIRDLVALVLHRLGRRDDAMLQYRKALLLAPDNPVYRENYAAALVKAAKPEAYRKAALEYETVLRDHPDRVTALFGLGSVLIKEQDPNAALVPLRHAQTLEPDSMEVLINLSIALAYTGDISGALALCDRSVALVPDDCLVLTNRGFIREHAGQYEAALEDYAAAIAASGHNTPEAVADAQLKRALLQMALGRLEEGWPLYMARKSMEWSDPRGGVLAKLLPAWDGVIRENQRLLVWGEQGVGDQVIYAAMLPELAARGARLRFACDPRLVTLFRRSFPMLDIVPIMDGRLPELAKTADVQIGLGDVGAILRRTLADFPPPRAYLRPDPALVAEFRARYQSHGAKLVVGLSWRSKNQFYGRYKSIDLQDWAPLLQNRDVLFVDMQYGDTAAERSVMQDKYGVTIFHDDSVDAMNDLDRYAAQAAALDLLISTSNTGLHMAAAAGVPCWGLLAAGVGRLWYWFIDRSDSLWYPNLRLFRQHRGRGDNWSRTIEEVRAALENRIAGRNG